MSVSISGDGSLTGIDQGLNVVGVVTATTLNVGTGVSISSPATNVLTLGTNGSERVRVDSSGNFNLVNTAGIMTAFKYETPALINNHFKSNSTSAGAYVRMYAAAGTGQWDIYNNGANLRFSDNASAGNIQMDRPLVMNSQNIVMSSGNGIDFSATTNSSGTMTSELLSDYEEGTWTPVDNSAGLTLSTADGRYVKIGRIVHCWARIQYPSTANTNASSIGGFPYTNLWSSPVTYSGNISITDFNNTNILPMVENQNIQFRTFGNAAYNNSQLSGKFIYVEFRLFV